MRGFLPVCDPSSVPYHCHNLPLLIFHISHYHIDAENFFVISPQLFALADIQTAGQTDRQTDRQTHIKTQKWTDRRTDRHRATAKTALTHSVAR